jgi:hypothetical protein
VPLPGILVALHESLSNKIPRVVFVYVWIIVAWRTNVLRRVVFFVLCLPELHPRNPRCYCLRSRHSARAQPRLTCARLLNTHICKNDNSVAAARVRVIILFRSLARAHVKQREDVPTVHPPTHPRALLKSKHCLSLEWVNEQHAGDGKQTRGDKTSTRAPH